MKKHYITEGLKYKPDLPPMKTLKEQIAAVELNPSWIAHMRNPSLPVQLRAIREDYRVIEVIKCPY